MYISIKLPAAFGSFNKLQKENYPFNNLFTAYLKAVSKLGLAKSMDVEELVGYIEDRIFEDKRLPDVPEGNEPVNIRYKTDDPDVVKYIGNSAHTNRMAVMYIARMTLRLSAAYGTSLFRLTKLINDMEDVQEQVKAPEKVSVKTAAKPSVKSKTAGKKESEKLNADGMLEALRQEEEPVPMPRISNRTKDIASSTEETQSKESSVLKSAEAARAAISQLTELTAQAEEKTDMDLLESEVQTDAELSEPDTEQEEAEPAGDVVEMNPLLGEFYKQ